jgi:hypothetical protein
MDRARGDVLPGVKIVRGHEATMSSEAGTGAGLFPSISCVIIWSRAGRSRKA